MKHVRSARVKRAGRRSGAAAHAVYSEPANENETNAKGYWM